MFNRSIQTALDEMMQQYSVVTLTGPRQSGKTTLVKTQYPEKAYYNFENPDVLALVSADPRQFIQMLNLQKGVILDEIQKFPQLISYIQTTVDEYRIPGAFILTGSHQLQLSEVISQSLAGRTALLELLPLSITELKNNNIEETVDEYLLNGFFPGVYEHDLDPISYARNYIKTYVERDVRQLIHIRDLQCFQRFLKLCAARISSTINRENLSGEVGVSQNTIKQWMTILEASYLTFQLQPYFENLGKRMIKAPKLYFLDVGLVSYLLGIQSTDQLNIDKMRGCLFENMVILEIIKYQYNLGNEGNIYFYRDSHQNEVDIILKNGHQLIPVEIKSTSTFHPSLLKNIRYFQDLVPNRAPIGFLIYSGEQEQQIGNIHVMNYKNIFKLMQHMKRSQ